MSTTKKPMRARALAVAGGLAIVGVTGAGLASGASAAPSSSASSTLAKIKYCESGGNYQAVNSSSGASGAYQFLNSTWRGLSAAQGYSTAASAPASVQDAAALELYNQAGTSPWAASSGCWSKLTSVPASSSTTTSASSTANTASATSSAAATTTASKSVSSNTTLAAAKPKPVGPAHAHQGKPKHPAPTARNAVKHHGKGPAGHPLKKPTNSLGRAA